ncbi:MAG: polysaccharide deacetylase family protein [Prolixibacteraceae bacterium]|jgi:peptidoglycan/xylan/chitin deacetylase (PgdA/CDA1 family)|nr:polysaccharide deacetylase family protein [Prolixibacteraceae bacterium]
MNRRVRNNIAYIGNLFPLSVLNAGKNFPPFLPFYHVASDESIDYINSYNIRSSKEFESELDYLLTHYDAVDLTEIIENPSKQKMHLSFDDGLKECSNIIAPILMRKGVPATFFVSPDFVDNQSIFHRFKRAILEANACIKPGGKRFAIQEVDELDQLAKQNSIDFSAYKPYMSLAEIEELHKSGFTIGAHSMNHPEMWTLSEELQFQQIKQSMQWVNEKFNPQLKAFSFPFTDDQVSLSLFSRLQTENITDVTFGTAGLKFDVAPNHFQRIPVELAQKWAIKKVVHFEYFYFKIRNLFSANTVKRQ